MKEKKTRAQAIADSLYDSYDKAGCAGLIFAIIIVLAISFGVLCLEGWLVMLLWNNIIAGPFEIQEIGFWWTTGAIFLFQLVIAIIKASFKQ